MWTRALIKQNAKLALKNFYWMGFLACILVSVIAGFASSMVSNISTAALMPAMLANDYSTESAMFASAAVFLIMMVLMMVATYGVVFFVSCPLNIGLTRFFLESRCFKSKLERIFCVFSSGKNNYLQAVKTMFFYMLKIFLWSLLFVIPGIVKSYEYRMVPYLIAENPTLPTKRYFELSSQMTDGEKLNMWILDLSFIGWYLLGALAFGVGVLFVAPYVQATWSELYTALREKAFGMNFSGPDELIGIHPPMGV